MQKQAVIVVACDKPCRYASEIYISTTKAFDIAGAIHTYTYHVCVYMNKNFESFDCGSDV